MEIVFNKKWFLHNQRLLLWLINHTWLRVLLDIPKVKVVQLLPDSFTVHKGGNEFVLEAYSGDRFAKLLYLRLRYLWWGLHLWDLLFDRLAPKLSFGFDTLTVYPAAGSNSPVNGNLVNVGAVFATIQSAGTGTAANVDPPAGSTWASTQTAGADFLIIRGIALFDTSPLGASAVISSTSLSLYGNGGASNADSTSLNIYSSNPAADNTLATSDFGSVGTTAFASNFDLGNWTNGQYNDFSFNATGISNVSLTGLSKFSVRTVRDVSASAPTGANYANGVFAAQAGTTQDPKLVVTYTLPSAGGGSNKFLGLLGVGN